MPNYMPGDDLIDALAQSGLLDRYMQEQQYRQGRGAELSRTPMPEGFVAQPGYHSPGLGEYVLAGLKQRAGYGQEAGAQQMMAQMLRKEALTRGDYYRYAFPIMNERTQLENDYLNSMINRNNQGIGQQPTLGVPRLTMPGAPLPGTGGG